MASAKDSKKDSVKLKSPSSTPYGKVNTNSNSNATRQTSKSVRVTDKRSPPKGASKPFVRSTSSPLMPTSSVAVTAHKSKGQDVGSPSQTRGVKSKRQPISKVKQSSTESKRSTGSMKNQSSTESKQSPSPKTKQATNPTIIVPQTRNDETERQDCKLPESKSKDETDQDTKEQTDNEVKVKDKDGHEQHKGRRLLDVVRERCLAKGRHGVHGLGLLFRHLDTDYNKRIVFDELKDKLKDFGVDMSDNNLVALFKVLDVDRSGGIDFMELMTSLRPPMEESRQRVIEEAFDKMDTNGNGVIELEEIRGQVAP